MDFSEGTSQLQTLVEGQPLNELLTHEIGYGSAQRVLTRPICLILFSQGCETVALGLLLPILTRQWALSTFDQSLLLTLVYLGIAIGSFLQIYSDRMGRYSFVLYNAIIQTIFGLFSCLSWSFGSFLVARFFYGIGIGICLPLSTTYISEITPGNMRATEISKSRLYWSFGGLFGVLLGWYFLRDSSWRTFLFFLCLPGIYALYQQVKQGKQSLRYLWVQKRNQEVCQMIDYMCRLNGRQPVSHDKICKLIQKQLPKAGQDLPLSELFNEKYRNSSIRLLLLWFVICFMFYGILMLLPTVLTRIFDKNQIGPNFKYLFMSGIAVVQISVFFTTPLADHPSVGRKKCIYLGFFIVLISSLFILALGESHVLVLFFSMAILKFVVSSTFLLMNPFSAEVYETMIRAKALGILSTAGRVGSTLVGFVGVGAMQWFGGNGLYVIYAVISAVSSYAAFTLPFCTRGRPIT